MKTIIIFMFGLMFGYEFNTSSQLAYYFVQDVTGYEMQTGDWIYSFCGAECVGGKAWQGPYTDIPAYGDDGSPETDGYCYSGEIPAFKIVKADGTEISVSSITPKESSQGMSNPAWSQFNMPIVVLGVGISTPDIKIVISIEGGELKAWKVDPANLIPVE